MKPQRIPCVIENVSGMQNERHERRQRVLDRGEIDVPDI
jgi:hypothetical protein